MMSNQQLKQQHYKTQQGSLDAYAQRYQSQQELLRRRAAPQAQNIQNAKAALQSSAAPTRPGNAMSMEPPKHRHKLYVKSKDTNCEFAYDYFAKKYNKDAKDTGSGMSDGYTKISKRDNLELQIEVINILRQPDMKPAWLKAVPCLLYYNKQNDSWSPHYGSKCMSMMHRIAMDTPPDVAKNDDIKSYNKGSGFAINNTFEYAEDPRYNAQGKVSGEEMTYMEQVRSTQDQKYQSQQHAKVDLTIKDDPKQNVNYQQYMAQRKKMPTMPTQNNQKVFTRPEMLY